MLSLPLIHGRLLLALLAVAWLCIQTGAPTVHALTLNVLCGVPQLKAAINDANSNVGPDVISLSANCVYTLSTVDNVEFGGDNGLPIITEELVIEGNGATIQRSGAGGTPDFRILRSTAGTLTVRHLTVRNGRLVEDDTRGAGIRTSVDLILEDSVISSNSISAMVDAQGGGTFSSATSTIRRSRYTGNSASSSNGAAVGGGAFSFGAFSAEDTEFSENAVSSGNVALGGGSATMGTANIESSAYLENTSVASGAGSSAGGAHSQLDMTVADSTFSGNTATATGLGPGTGTAVGAGSRTQGSLSVSNSTYAGNITSGSNGAQGGGSYSFSGTVVSRSTYSANIATSSIGAGEGGGIYALGTMSVRNSTISSNTASGPGVVSAGGGMFSVQTMTLSHVTVTDNVASGSVDARGGGAFIVNDVVITNSIVALNTNGDCTAFGGTTASLRNIDSDGSCGNATTTVTPGLLPLALNAPGTTKTHALAVDSIAVDLGSACQPVDQTGVSRPKGLGCDVGAWEAGFLVLDVDCDRDEDATDVLTVLRMLAGLESAPIAQAPCDADTEDDVMWTSSTHGTDVDTSPG